MWGENPEKFLEQPWSEFTDFLERKSVTDSETQCVYKPPTSSVKLERKGMKIFGYHLERDSFSMVVCDMCQKLVKPQVFKNHIEARHSKVTSPKSPLPKPFQSLVKSNNAKVRLKKASVVISKADSTTLSAFNDTNNNTGTVNCSVNLIDTTVVSSSAGTSVVMTPTRDALPSNNLSSVIESEPTNIDILDNYDNPVSSGNCNASGFTSQIEVGVQVSKTNASQISTDMDQVSLANCPVLTSPISVSVSLPLNNIGSLITVPAATATGVAPKGRILRATRKARSAKEKEYDADRHCGVLVNDKPCKRSLTCSLHSMPLRRAVLGRTKPFNQLLAEHRATKDPMIMIKKTDTTLNSSNNAAINVKLDNTTVGHLALGSSKFPVVTGVSNACTGALVSADGGGLRVSESVSLLNPSALHMQQSSVVESCPPELVASTTQSDSTTDNSSLTSPPSIVIVNRTQILSRPTHLTLSSFSKVVDFTETPPPPPTSDVSTLLDIVFTSAHPKPLAVGGMFNHRKIGGLVYCHRKIGMTRHFLSDFKDI